MTEHSILIVEDELKLARLLGDYFLAEGFQVTLLGDGTKVIDSLKNNKVSMVLLDIMLPGKDGMSLCREIRTFSDVPIIMVTARVDEIDRLLGLELGADDYICKPFSPREVVARVRAVLRRIDGNFERENPWQLDESRLEFHHNSMTVSLTSVEFHMLKRLCKDPGRIYTRAQLMDDMYADNRVVSERTIDSHVKKLRKKLSVSSPDFIESVYGVGYRISA